MDLLERNAPSWTDVHTDAWVSAGLISREQADAIRDFEHGAEPGPRLAGPAARPPVEARLPVAAELAVYVGSLIALAGGFMVIERTWDELVYPVRLAIGVVLAAVAFVAGRVLARTAEAGTDRLASFMWAIATGGVSIAVATTMIELDVEPRAWITVVTGAAVVLASVWLWRNREERPLQLLTAFGGLIAVGAGLAVVTDVAPWVAGIVTAVVSITIGLVALAGKLNPRWLAMTGPAVGTIVGLMMIGELQEQLGFSLGCAAAVGVVAIALDEHDLPLLVVGVIGFLITLWTLLMTTFNSAVASPIVVVVGLAIVAIALARTLRRPPAGSG